MGKQPFGFSFDPSQTVTQNMELSPTKNEPKNESGNETDNTDDLLFDDREEGDSGDDDEDEFEESFLSKWKKDSLSTPKEDTGTETGSKLNGSGAFDEPMTETQILMMTQPEYMSPTPPPIVRSPAREEPIESRTEFICEEIIETVVTKCKRYYIRLGSDWSNAGGLSQL